MLTAGTVLRADERGDVRILRPIGEGGQGWVYEAETTEGEHIALKWYKPHAATDEQWAALEELIEQGPPDARFLWPTARAYPPTSEASGERAAFGYVMPLRKPNYVPLSRLVTDSVEPRVSYIGVITLCRQLVESFRLLHAQGLCYRDINLANVFFDPQNGDVLVCDVDNVGVDDGTSRILGAGFFMAPEIIRDTTRRTLPSRLTDLYSLAVLLFMVLFMEHPLEGRLTDRGLRDDEHLQRHFGQSPVFCLSPSDDANRPIRSHVQAYWELYPHFLRERFLAAFDENGLMNPPKRVTETEWAATLTRLRDSIGTCTSCNATVFFDAKVSLQMCYHCGEVLPAPLVLAVGKRRLVISKHLTFGSEILHRYEILTEPMAKAVEHPSDPSRIGLANLSTSPWRAQFEDESEAEIKPGQAVEVHARMTLHTNAFAATIASAAELPLESRGGNSSSPPGEVSH